MSRAILREMILNFYKVLKQAGAELQGLFASYLAVAVYFTPLLTLYKIQ